MAQRARDYRLVRSHHAVEVIVLAFNGWRCPLTSVAGRYTDERRDNFDIYLCQSGWQGTTSSVFGALYVAGVAFALVRCVQAPA